MAYVTTLDRTYFGSRLSSGDLPATVYPLRLSTKTRGDECALTLSQVPGWSCAVLTSW